MVALQQQRSRRLHNFSLPRLRWANHCLLRCINLTSSGESSPSSNPIVVDTDGIEAMMEKLMLDLRAAADNTNLSFFSAEKAAAAKVTAAVAQDLSLTARPWNLRTRRAACKAPPEKDCCSSPQRAEPATAAAASRLAEKKSGGGGDDESRRRKFSVALSRAEIEEDFREMTRVRPPRRSKKRPKVVQREVDALFPGLWLIEITPET